jgi:hypothetical protein
MYSDLRIRPTFLRYYISDQSYTAIGLQTHLRRAIAVLYKKAFRISPRNALHSVSTKSQIAC